MMRTDRSRRSRIRRAPRCRWRSPWPRVPRRDRLRHRRGENRRARARPGPEPRGSARRASGEHAPAHRPIRHLEAGHLLRRRRAHAGRRQQRPGPRARDGCVRNRRPGLKGAVVVYESTVYPGVHRGHLRADTRARVSGLKRERDFKSATRPSASTRATRSTVLATIIRSSRARRRSARARRLRSTASIIKAGIARAPEHQRRRGRQGYREHAARPQHRADQRAGAHLQSHGHRHRGRARGRRHQMELPAVSRRAWSAATASASTRIT